MIAAAVIVLLSLLILALMAMQRKAATRALATLKSEYQYLFHQSPCGFFTLDIEGRFADVGDTLLQWLGYQREELAGRVKFVDLAIPADRVLVDKALSISRDGGSPKGDFSLTKKNGERFAVLLRSLKIGGKVLYCIIDNTECNRALERIRNLDQELEEFSYSISHDLRAPLRSIDGYSKILQEDYGDHLDDEGRRVLFVIMNNARRMGKLIDDLLEFSRLGRKEMQLSRVDMKSMVDGIVHQLLEQTPDRKIEVQVDSLHPAVSDPDMMRLVWFNLLENAFKYTGREDVAVIEVRSSAADGEEVRYEIKDNGVGFDMKYAPKLFGVFQRLHKIQDFGGTGVGLAIVKRIISRHGGRVWTEASLGKGAIFYFTIPVKEEDAQLS
jgi:PAS domain S-box-containing protein